MGYARRLAEIRAKIRSERRRQIDVEGWSETHDDTHDDGSLLSVAVFYYQHAARPEFPLQLINGAPEGWPWAPEWWKPKDRHRDLIRAAALCHAEIDRLKRGGRQFIHVEHKLRLIEGALVGARQ